MTSTRAPIHRVLVAFDGSAASRAALQAAIDEASSRNIGLQVVTAIDPVPGIPLAQAMYAETTRKTVQEAAASATGVLGEGRVGTTVEVGAASALVLRTCLPGDLLVVGSHGHRPVARMLLGSTSTALATHATCPVMVVKAPPLHPSGYILVGVDGSAAATDALLLAADEAERRGVALRTVIAVPPVVDAMGFVSGPDESALSKARAVLAEALAAVRAEYPDLPVEQQLAQAHPVEALLRDSRAAQLVVVGTRGLGGLRSMLLGSVGRELMQRAQCPVLVMHPIPGGDQGGDVPADQTHPVTAHRHTRTPV